MELFGTKFIHLWWPSSQLSSIDCDLHLGDINMHIEGLYVAQSEAIKAWTHTQTLRTGNVV